MQTSINRTFSILQKNYIWFAKLLITFSILFFVISSIPVQNYKDAFSQISLRLIISICFLVVIQIFFLALRWRLLVNIEGKEMLLSNAMLGTVLSFFFSQGLPASLGSDAFRIWWHKKNAISTNAAVKIIFFDRLYGFLSLLILTLISSFMLIHFLGKSIRIIMLLLVIVTLASMFGGFILSSKIKIPLFFKSRFRILPSWLQNILRWVVSIRTSLIQQEVRLTSSLIMISLLTHLIVVLQSFIVGYSLGLDSITLSKCLAVVPPAIFVGYLPFSIAGWGVREASMVVTFGLLGIGATTAVLISLTIGMSVLLVSLLGGLLWLKAGFQVGYKNENL